MTAVVFTKHARRNLRKLPADLIEGAKDKVYRFRIGDYRVIFDWEDSNILVTKVSHRGRAY